MSLAFVIRTALGWRLPILTGPMLPDEAWASWIIVGIPAGLAGAIVGGFRGRWLNPAKTVFRAVVGALIGSSVAGAVTLLPEVGVGVLTVMTIGGFTVLGAVVGWIAGGGGKKPKLALLGCFAGTLAFSLGVPTFSDIGDWGGLYGLVSGLVVGGVISCVHRVTRRATSKGTSEGRV